MLIKQKFLLLIILSFFAVESAECIENVGNRYGIVKTIGPYTTQNTFCPTNCGQCTAFAWGRALDRLGIITTFTQSFGRHACTWPNIISNQGFIVETDYTKPRANSFVIWGYDSPCDENNTGHVAYIEEVNGSDVYINEANIATYTPGDYGGGYDGYTKKLTISEIATRTGVGGPFKAYIYLPDPYTNYWYWNFDNQGTEDWNAREAVNQGIYNSEYWQIGSYFENNITKRGVVSPLLNDINTDQYKVLEIKFGINNSFLEKIDVYFMVNDIWQGPYDVNWVEGSRTPGSQNIYRCYIPVSGQIQQLRVDFSEGSNLLDVRIYIDKIALGGLNRGPWPMFGSNKKHTRVSSYKGPSRGKIIWNKYVNQGIGPYTLTSNPTIDYLGNIYIGGHLRYTWDYPPTSWIDYYKLFKFGELGSYTTIITDNYNRFCTAPAVTYNGDKIFVGTDDSSYCTWNVFYALNSDGTEAWHLQGNDYRSSPTLDDNGNVYFGSTDGCNVIGGKVYSYKLTGEKNWEYKPTGIVHFNTSPAVGDDGSVYITGTNGRLYAIDTLGNLKWQLDGFNSSPALGNNGNIYVTGTGGTLTAITPDGAVSWSYPLSTPSSPAINRNSTVYITADSNKLYAINSNGTLKWVMSGPTSAPAIDDNGIIYTCSSNKLYAIQDNGSPTILWSIDINQSGDPIVGPNNKIYIAGNTILTAVGIMYDGDFNNDSDVDGSDLAALIANTSLIDLATFAQNFGK